MNFQRISEGILRPATVPEDRPKRSRAKKRASPPIDPEGRHYHLDMNDVPFILGASTNPSHNVKSNVQNVRRRSTANEVTERRLGHRVAEES